MKRIIHDNNKYISYDFTLDNIISVKDKEGLNPFTLHDKCLAKLKYLIDKDDVSFLFERIYEE
jgi:hypothetical protein